MAPDHPWAQDHPEYFVAGTESDLTQAPQNYTRVTRKGGSRILAYGRDPYFAGWPDTLQLDYSNPATQEAMIGELLRIAGQCDGLRCDMAMLVLPDVFERTWGRRAPLFWPEATRRVRERVPGFRFMLTYGVAITLYLAYVGLADGLTGTLLWPVVVLHLILTTVLVRASTLVTRR